MQANLKDVPETMLWTLHNRAVEAMRPDRIIQDDMAISIYQNINYDYEASFGKAEASHAVRSLDFDREIKHFLNRHPDGNIVNLGEGLETQRFRIDESTATWFTVDLPESIAIREQFIRPDDRHVHIALSATDERWLNEIPNDEPVFITAQGLFMYFTEDEVKQLVQTIEKYFLHWVLMFDTIPEWLSKKTLSSKGWAKTDHYRTPLMPWGINRNHIQFTVKSWLSAKSKTKVTDLGFSLFPRGFVRYYFGFFSKAPLLKNITPTIVKIEVNP